MRSGILGLLKFREKKLQTKSCSGLLRLLRMQLQRKEPKMSSEELLETWRTKVLNRLRLQKENGVRPSAMSAKSSTRKKASRFLPWSCSTRSRLDSPAKKERKKEEDVGVSSIRCRPISPLHRNMGIGDPFKRAALYGASRVLTQRAQAARTR